MTTNKPPPPRSASTKSRRHTATPNTKRNVAAPAPARSCSWPCPCPQPPINSPHRFSNSARCMLWLCLHFPGLPLEIFSRAEPHAMPWVVSHGNGTRRQVLLCNALAAARGIRAGMSLSAAYGLTPSLHVRARDAAAERQALNAIAAWAGQYTSLVSLAPPQSLLLEIKGSLTLFKGLDALLRRLLGQLAQLGYRSDVGIAPTPLAAELLALAGMTQPVIYLSELQTALRDVPLGLLALDDKQTRALHGLGLRRLGDLLRLPRADLARRLGQSLIDYLDRLLDRRSDPREPYIPPPYFKRRLHLPAETAAAEALLFPAQRLCWNWPAFCAHATRARSACTGYLRITDVRRRASPSASPHPVATRLICLPYCESTSRASRSTTRSRPSSCR